MLDTIEPIIEATKNIINILFFVIISVVTVLSYIQARRTFFAPIRTETFKLQLKAFEEVLLFFQNKSESDYVNVFDLHTIVSLNTLRMVDCYVAEFFPDEIDIDQVAREEVFSVIVGGTMNNEFLKKYYTVPHSPISQEEYKETTKITNPAVVFSRWKKYEHGYIEFTAQYVDQVKLLRTLSASPLLPKELRELIGDFVSLPGAALGTLERVLTACSKEMPTHCATAVDLKKFSDAWIWNKFNDEKPKFEPLAEKILDYVNSYLKVEDLMQ
ncbi:hypothetical protein [Paraburkholderia sp. GAS32]|jgi:hypothetical protein|uniref:hypothetical protein n=1 Tax=Paraburkholderia sp. GAS32 TaxID=3035129 RepID=UPI003D1D17A9